MNLIHEAIIFAARKHAGQVRKGTDIPYITHPILLGQFEMVKEYKNLLEEVFKK